MSATPANGRNGLRNYLAHSVDGGLFIGGIAFVAPESVLPRIVQSLGGPAWVIAVMPVAIILGFVLPGLLVAHRLERLERTLPIILAAGVIQRIPFLAAGLTLLLIGESRPGPALAVVVLAPLLSGLAGGITFPAWMELVAKTLPPARRASAMAIRMIIASMIGITSGAIIAAVLDRWPGMPGFGVLHLITFVFTVLSISVLALVREEPGDTTHHGPALGLRDNLKAVPGILRGAPGLPCFVAARVLTCSFFIPLPFMAIHALSITGHPDSYLGILVSAQMAGAIAGNVISGIIGDRSGARRPSLMGAGTLFVLCAAVPYGTSWSFFVGCFAVLGFGMGCMRVGMMTLALELVPVAKRSTAVATIGWFMAVGLIGSSAIGGLLWSATQRLNLLGAVSAALMLIAVVLLARIPEPRNATLQQGLRIG